MLHVIVLQIFPFLPFVFERGRGREVVRLSFKVVKQ